MVAEMDNYAERFAIIEPVLDESISSHACRATLNPGISAHFLDARKTEILHQTECLGVRAEVRVQKPMRSRVFISVSESDFVAERVLLKKLESVSEADVVIGFRREAWPDEVRSEHDEQIRRRAGSLGFAGKR